MKIYIGKEKENKEHEEDTFLIKIMSYEGNMDSPNKTYIRNLSQDEFVLIYKVLYCLKKYGHNLNSYVDAVYVLKEHMEEKDILDWWYFDESSDNHCRTIDEFIDESEYFSEWLSNTIGYYEYNPRWIDSLTVEYIDRDRRHRDVKISNVEEDEVVVL